MGGMLTQPITQKGSQQGKGLGLKYGLSSMQGWRPEMEDTHDVKLGLKYGLDDWSFFAVFDGHAGKCAAAYAAWNLLDHILKDSEFELGVDNWPEPKEKEPPNSNDPPQGTSNASTDKEAINADTKEEQKTSDDNKSSETDKTFNAPSEHTSPYTPTTETTDTKLDQEVQPKSKFATFPVLKQLDMVKNAIRSGFLSIDQKMRLTSTDMSGCTAVCALISPTHLFIANCGDSRAVLYSGQIVFSTVDHKPFHPRERKRIIDAGGTATQRINGTLAVSRALGDFEFKKDDLRGPCEQLVSPEPEVTVLERHPNDEFLILACDGIWDVMTNYELCEFVKYKLKIEPSLENVCSSVLDVCLHKGSRDNMSIIIVVFENGPSIQPSEIRKDQERDELLIEKVDDLRGQLLREGDDSTFSEFFEYLRSEVEEGLFPPGAGIEGKYDLLRVIFERKLPSEETPTTAE